MNFEILTTKRLQLRKVTPETIGFVLDNYSEAEALKYYGYSDPTLLQPERDNYAKGLRTYERTFLYFHLVLDDENIGWCGYHTWYPKHQRAEIGYVMTQENQKRKGLMSEALDAVLDYGFKAMNLNRVEALTSYDNEPSQRLLLKRGFLKEGVLREHYNTGKALEDSVMFSLLLKDYKP